MPQAVELRTRADAEAMLAASHARPVVLLKHSALCLGSMRGKAQFARLEADDGPPLYLVVVQDARDVSNYIAERLGVRHETPQALVIHGGEATLHLNHAAITTERLRAALGP